MGIDLLYGAKLLNELGGSLPSNAGDTGDVIRGVAYQPLEVSDMFRLNAIFLAYRRLVIEHGITEASPRFGIEHPYPR